MMRSRGGAARPLALLSMLLVLAWPAVGAVAPEVHPLFRIERSKNANVVQYDALVGPDGRLDPDHPVDVYWLKLAKDGRRKELEWLERKLAYGFDAEVGPGRKEARLELRADIGREIVVRPVAGIYRAQLPIEGHTALLERVFVHAVDKGPIPDVKYVDLYGTDVASGEAVYERLTP